MAKAKSCKWCEAGYAVKEDGCHWIVASIIPAKISIVKCKLVEPAALARPTA